MLKIFILAIIGFFCTSYLCAQSYLPITGGTLTGGLNVGNTNNNNSLLVFRKIGSTGTQDYTNIGQHYLPFQIFNTTAGINNNRKIEIGVLDNGTAVLQANAAGEGYFPIHLNPVAGGVMIGNGNTMTTNYTLQVGGPSMFTSSLSVNGNVGIGTTNPEAQLGVAGNIKTFNGAATWDNLNIWSNGVSSFIQSNGDEEGLRIKSNVANKIILESNVGIGTNTPEAQLGVAGNIKTINGGATWDNLNIWSNGVSSFIQSNGDEEGLRIKSNIANKIILESNVGIGTANPTEMLSVNGNIRAKKLIVTQNGWPDYVFSTTYKLRPLAEVADYVQANKHLPDIPSAKEVEEKGLDIGKTQAALLKKIEELTLYIIELKKENVEMKKENSEIKKLFQQSAKQNK